MLRYSAVAGLFIVALTFQALPHLRGYEFVGRADSATYTGALKSLLLTGHVQPTNFYPAATLVAHQAVVLAGLPPVLVEAVGRALPLAVYVLGCVTLGRCILRSRQWDWIVVAAALLPVAGGYVANFEPAGFGIAMTPLAIATLFPALSSTAMGRRARAVILPAFALIHPLGSLVLLGVAAMYLLLSKVASLRASSNLGEPTSLGSAVALLSVSWLAWITPSIVFRKQLTGVRDALLSAGVSTPGADAIALAGRARLGLIDFVTLPVVTNLGVVLPAVIGLGGCLWALVFQRRRWRGRRGGFVFLIGTEVVLAAAFVGSLVVPVRLDIFRFLHFIVIVGPVLLGVTAAVIGVRSRTVAGLVVLAVGMASVPYVFNSHLIKTPTDLVPASEMSGIRWMLSHNDGPQALKVTSLTGLYTNVDLALGLEARNKRDDILVPLAIPDHFGLTPGTPEVHLGNPATALLALTVGDIMAYTGVWSSANRINLDDLARLEHDARISKAYMNDSFALYVVPPDSRAASP